MIKSLLVIVGLCLRAVTLANFLSIPPLLRWDKIAGVGECPGGKTLMKPFLLAFVTEILNSGNFSPLPVRAASWSFLTLHHENLYALRGKTQEILGTPLRLWPQDISHFHASISRLHQFIKTILLKCFYQFMAPVASVLCKQISVLTFWIHPSPQILGYDFSWDLSSLMGPQVTEFQFSKLFTL